MNVARVLFACLLFFIGGQHLCQAETRWPRWRGPSGDGQSAETQLPVEWTPADVAWKTELPGRGQSSPIVWDGTTVVLEPSPEMKIVARNKLETSGDEIFRASPAPCEGQLLLRSDRALYCVGRRHKG